MKIPLLLALVLALPSVCFASIRPIIPDGGAGAIVIAPGGDIGLGGNSGIPYPSHVEPAPGGQVVIRGGDISLSTGNEGLTPVVSAVPEPEAFAMLLAGLGVVGVVARRRKLRSHAVQYAQHVQQINWQRIQ